MPPVFYTEVRNKSIDYVNNVPTDKERVRVTRYCTEFNPDPDSFLTILDRWSQYETGKLRRGKMKPGSITIDQGNWDVRIDWREEWEELADEEVPTETILGIQLYNVKRTRDLGADRFREITLSSGVWGTPVEQAAHYQKLGRSKGTTSVEGTALGRVSYAQVLGNIKEDDNVADVRLVYSRNTGTTAVMIRLEDDNDD